MKKIFTLLTVAFCTAAFGQYTNETISRDATNVNLDGSAYHASSSLNQRTNDEIAALSHGFEEINGYITGDINFQGGWTVTGAGTGYVEGQTVINTDKYAGSQSLSIGRDTRYAAQSNPILGAFENYGDLITSKIEAYVKFNTTGGAIYRIATVDTVASLFKDQFTFNFTSGQVTVADYEVGQYIVTNVATSTISPNTWYKIEIEFNPTAATIDYKLDGVTLYTRTGVEADGFGYDQARFVHDNKTGAGMILDGSFTEDEGGMATSDANKKSKISVYPNPATNFVNINNEAGEVIESITLGDLTGRTVKYLKSSDKKVDLQGLPKGVYVLKIKTNKGLNIQKVIKN